MENKTAIGLALVAILIAIGALLHSGGSSKSFGAVATGPGCGGSVTCLLGDFYASASVTGNTLVSLTTALVPGTLFLGGATTATSMPINGNRSTLAVSTTTPCAIQSPAATSTLQIGSVKFTVGTSTAMTVTMAKAATAFATTTLLGQAVAIAAGAQGTLVASTTASNLVNNDFVFAPSQWFVVGVAGAITAGDAAGTGFVPAGSCTAEFATN